MANWETLSESRRAWMLYRAICHLEPNATLQAAQVMMNKLYEIDLPEGWIRQRARRFQKTHLLNVVHSRDADGNVQQYWFSTGKHEHTTRVTSRAGSGSNGS